MKLWHLSLLSSKSFVYPFIQVFITYSYYLKSSHPFLIIMIQRLPRSTIEYLYSYDRYLLPDYGDCGLYRSNHTPRVAVMPTLQSRKLRNSRLCAMFGMIGQGGRLKMSTSSSSRHAFRPFLTRRCSTSHGSHAIYDTTYTLKDYGNELMYEPFYQGYIDKSRSCHACGFDDDYSE